MKRQARAACFTGKGWSLDGELLGGWGIRASSDSDVNAALSFLKSSDDFAFVGLSYEVKDQLEAVTSRHQRSQAFPELFCFQPRFVVRLFADRIDLYVFQEDVSACDQIIAEMAKVNPTPWQAMHRGPSHVASKTNYLQDLQLLKQHIQRGDVYQANYCQEFVWSDMEIDPAALFLEGFDRMPNPFSGFVAIDKQYLLCFSPERFLRFDGKRVTSQPMKGTSPRGTTPEEDLENLEALRASEKDRRENVMIVDLVRNDLSHHAEKGSVHVPELYTIETYPKVHQMHSTVVADIKSGVHAFEVLLHAFPMGSMTGAPKIRAMELLDQLERSRRGIYSGTIGFFTPEGNGDFNVVIRSLVYDAEQARLSCHAGGGITILSDPHAEYEESLVKARPIFELLDAR